MDAYWLLLRCIPLSIPPIVFLTLAFTLGILLEFAHLSLWYSYIGLTCLAFCTFSSKKPERTFIILFLCSLAITTGYYRTAMIHQKERAFSYFLQNTPFTLTGLVTGIEKIQGKRFKEKISIALHTIVNSSKEITAPFVQDALAYIPYRTGICVGQKIKITEALLIKKSGIETALKSNISSLRFSTPGHTKVMIDPSMSSFESIKATFIRARNSIMFRISHKLLPLTNTLFTWLFLGLSTQDEDTHCLKEQCKSWGISHYLARSGLHVGMMLVVWQILFAYVPLPLLLKELLLLLILLLTTFLSWPSISFSRAATSYIFLKCYSLTRISIHPFHTSFLTCFLFLLYNPLYLFNVSFQLSFLGVFLLIWIQEIELLRKRPIDALQNF